MIRSIVPRTGFFLELSLSAGFLPPLFQGGTPNTLIVRLVSHSEFLVGSRF